MFINNYKKNINNSKVNPKKIKKLNSLFNNSENKFYYELLVLRLVTYMISPLLHFSISDDVEESCLHSSMCWLFHYDDSTKIIISMSKFEYQTLK